MNFLPLVLLAAATVYADPNTPITANEPDAHLCSKALSGAAIPIGLNDGLLRLLGPSSTDVLNYALDLEIDPVTKWLGGSNTITVQSLQDGLSSFAFRLDTLLEISAVTVGGNPVTWQRTTFPEVLVTLDRPYGSGEIFDLRIEYNGFPRGAAGSFSGQSITFTSRDGNPLVYSLSQPFYAYTWWPAKDDNADKATASLWLTVPAALTVASNGMLRGIDDVDGGRRRFRWQTDYPIMVYGVCFSASVYNTFSATCQSGDRTMPLEFFLFPSSDLVANRNAWLRTIDMIDVFGTRYGPYPFLDEKYGIYEFGWGGGMEHQTMTGQGGSPFADWLTAHELSHQWWGDMITCADWGHIWLNEGFARYSEAIWFAEQPGGGGDAWLRAYMGQTRSGINGTVYRADTSNSSRIFSITVYDKGAWLLHMLRDMLGDDAFFHTLLTYRERFAYGSVVTEDFQQVLEEISGRDLDFFFAQWVYQPGYPQYEYAWTPVSVGGKHYVELFIRQEQSAAWPTFQMPMEVRTLHADGQFVSQNVWSDAREEHLLFETATPATSLQFEPFERVLCRIQSAASVPPAPPKIASASPAPGEFVRQRDSAGVLLVFHKDVHITPGDVQLSSVRDPIALSMLYDAASRTVLLLPDESLPVGRYVLTVSDQITDVAAGLHLDGEIANSLDPASLPSGEGLPGGSAVLGFGVTRNSDLNRDGRIGPQDLALLLSSFGHSDDGDIDGDADTDASDLQVLLGDWGFQL